MKPLVLILSLVTLSACGGGSPAPELYKLTAHAPEMKRCKSGASIKIYEPMVAPGLDNPRIAVIDRPQHQTFYKGVRWNASAGRVVQNFFVDTFERSGMFATVTTDDSTTRTGWLMETQLREFHVDQSAGAPQVVVRLTASLVQAGSRNVVATLPLESSMDVTGRDTAGIIEAFNTQMVTLSEQMLSTFRSKLGC